MGARIRLVGGTDVDVRKKRESAFNKKVGARLQKWARDAGVTDEAMAEHLGINPTQVWRHYVGQTPLTCVRASRMASLAGRELKELFA